MIPSKLLHIVSQQIMLLQTCQPSLPLKLVAASINAGHSTTFAGHSTTFATHFAGHSDWHELLLFHLNISKFIIHNIDIILKMFLHYK